MNTLVGHSLILLGAATAAIAISFAVEHAKERTDGAAPVVVIAQQRAPVPRVETAVALPTNRDGLIRALQRELKRVGCYDGAVTGRWGAEPRRAMKAFLEGINASLPVDEPDDIQLRLLQAEEHVCTAPCPDERAEGCSRIAEAPDVSAPERAVAASLQPAPPAAERTQAPEAGPAVSTTQNLARPDGERLAGVPSSATVSTISGAPAEPRASEPIPPEPLSQSARRRVHKSHVKPPKIVRVLIRNVARSLAPFGVH